MNWENSTLVALVSAVAGLGVGAMVGGSRLVRVYDWDTEWHINAPLAEVYRVMTTPEEQKNWWPAMQVHSFTEVPDTAGGGIVDYRVQQASSVARFVPPFKIHSVTVDVEPERRTRTVVSGDLIGVLDILFYSQTPHSTRVRYHWYVRVRNPILNLAGFFAEKMFRASHDHVMRQGEAGLNRYLAEHALAHASVPPEREVL